MATTVPHNFVAGFDAGQKKLRADYLDANFKALADAIDNFEPPTPVDPYVLPVASADTLGGVKVGNGLEIEADGKLKAKAQEINIGPDMMKDETTNTISDKREVLYFEEMPEGGLPTEGVKNGAVAIIDDGEGGLPSGGGSGTTFIPSVSDAGVISWTNDGGKPNPDPVKIMGANGVAGFIPDISTQQGLPFQIITLDGCKTITCGPFEDDGWISIALYAAAADYLAAGFIEGDFNTDNERVRVYGVQGRKGNNVMPLMPVRKGCSAYFSAYTTTITAASSYCYFYKIYKPELTEERVVGYMNGKPVYEIAEQQPDGTVTMRRYTKTTD